MRHMRFFDLCPCFEQSERAQNVRARWDISLKKIGELHTQTTYILHFNRKNLFLKTFFVWVLHLNAICVFTSACWWYCLVYSYKVRICRPKFTLRDCNNNKNYIRTTTADNECRENILLFESFMSFYLNRLSHLCIAHALFSRQSCRPNWHNMCNWCDMKNADWKSMRKKIDIWFSFANF